MQRMRLRRRVVDDMQHVMAAMAQQVGDQPAMAAPPQHFGAQQRRASPGRQRQRPLQGVRELGTGHVVRIPLEGGVAPCAVGRAGLDQSPPAQPGQPQIGDARARQRLAHGFAGEPGMAARPREATHVGDRLDPVVPQQRHEVVPRPRGMADRPQGGSPPGLLSPPLMAMSRSSTGACFTGGSVGEDQDAEASAARIQAR